MYEYGIINIKTEETAVMFGRSIADAYRRSKLDKSIWYVEYAEYID